MIKFNEKQLAKMARKQGGSEARLPMHILRGGIGVTARSRENEYGTWWDAYLITTDGEHNSGFSARSERAAINAFLRDLRV